MIENNSVNMHYAATIYDAKNNTNSRKKPLCFLVILISLDKNITRKGASIFNLFYSSNTKGRQIKTSAKT